VHGRDHLRVDALVDANLQVEPGALVAVMGPSGSGKTTLLSLAGGLDKPTSGEVLVEGQSLAQLGVSELSGLRRRRIGYVFQQYNLIEGLTPRKTCRCRSNLTASAGDRRPSSR
jgi:putative ABC transport system ATP-binding protein